MATLNVNVDTTPMAQEISTVSGHVTGTTAAVVAMQAAVIKAEHDAADHVCHNVNRGFYNLILSQISQKSAKLQSEVDSHLMILSQQRKALIAIQDRMGRDYRMISARYFKTFDAFNKNLRNRIFELDKPVMTFATREVEKISNRTKHLTATVPVSQIESVSTSQKIVSSNLKNKGWELIFAIKSFLADMEDQKLQTARVLINDTYFSKEGESYLPVAVMEMETTSAGARSVEIAAPNIGQKGMHGQMANAAVASAGEFAWKPSKGLHPETVGEFNRLTAESDASSRVKKMMEKMLGDTNFETL